MLLQGLGVRDVKCASSVDKAFNIFQHDPLDLVISDWSPGIDGIHFLSMVRNDNSETNPYIPIILLSAYSDATSLNLAVNAGINDYISKPFTARHIYKHIKNVIEVPNFFVRSGVYFGPCRRHIRVAPHSNQNEKTTTYAGDERRVRDINIENESANYLTSIT